MEDSLNKIEDQPAPADDPQPAFQEAVNGLGQQLMRKFQLSGNQFNALELELRVFVLVEQVNLLTKIIQVITGGYPDAQLTEQLTAQLGLLTRTLSGELDKAPRIALATGAPPRGLNGAKHN